ncbi:MAG: hypothetical protein K0R40_2960 [Burkholderiales bacterium]|nr:hypothetical protein [Burkholderiales bacterium]
MRYSRYLPVVFLVLAGCQTGVSPEEMASVNYGAKPARWQEEVRSYMAIRVPDAATLKLDFKNEPQQMVQMTFWFRDDKIVAVNGGPDDSNIIGAKYAREQCEKLGFLFKP